ncbi:hypothetical protein A3C23_03485 [Candidatus Roizmanbacteria bacterium RIFCSPHIGHO2_02_FULL_37_13b]|uniref:DNA polymerase III subunit delta n=1 Tax=Candidatus Roizmanbacteria bacterium RIFCSPLOWO2_02_FULL_36_11 TaxID=1802071 RepID=A0A1F7JC31_9BACT|nr:MAG: hypothetical protein A3C23_03485 [Candidatus Roizmanbacteria bacterium RIFCSPHIGHO2_02_FULL_37_13b]OGK53151.1 MAG: hypothetical protein A3H78_02090 [Candidatus Roizmanbacteria bacterium RIFCSPLOWO2_02_FULL_36_11]
MLPIILISPNRKETEKYINYLKKKYYPKALVHEFEKDPNIITIDQIREITSLFKFASKMQRIIVVHNFETAKEETQNAFLKTLEESSVKAQFVLVTTDVNAMLPTIHSRCRIFRLNKSEVDSVDFDFNLSLFNLLSSMTLKKRDKIEGIAQCDRLISYFKARFIDLSKKNIVKLKIYSDILKEVINVRRLLDKNNLNPQLALDHLIIFIKKTISKDSDKVQLKG